MILSGKLVIGLAAVAALAFVSGWLTRSVTTPKPNAAGPVGLASELKVSAPAARTTPSDVETPGVTRILIDAPQPEARDVSPNLPTEPTMEEALAALDRAIRSRPIQDDFDRGFEAKYANASVDALKEARELVRSQVQAAEAAITKERIAMGLYETDVVAPGDGTPRPIARKARRGTTVLSGSSEPSGDGSIVGKTVEIHPEDYPEYDAVLREYTWLRRKLDQPVSAKRQ